MLYGRPMLHCRLSVAACIAIFSVAFLAARTKQSEIAILNQLAPKIERAEQLSPDTRTAIERLLVKAQTRLDSAMPRDANNFRQLVIVQRVAAAINQRPTLSAVAEQRSLGAIPRSSHLTTVSSHHVLADENSCEVREVCHESSTHDCHPQGAERTKRTEAAVKLTPPGSSN